MGLNLGRVRVAFRLRVGVKFGVMIRVTTTTTTTTTTTSTYYYYCYYY